MTDFKDIKLNKQLFQAIENLGFDKQTPIQEHTFSKILLPTSFIRITNKTLHFTIDLDKKRYFPYLSLIIVIV